MIFHIDRSDPVVSVALTAHVGTAREKAGRTVSHTCSSTSSFSNPKTLEKDLGYGERVVLNKMSKSE